MLFTMHGKRAFCLLALVVAATLVRSCHAILPTLPMPVAGPLIVEACDIAGSGLSQHQVESLTDRGYSKCCFGAFGVLVAGTHDYPDAYVLTACVTVANLLDQDQDGEADDPAVVAALSFLENDNPPLAQGAPTQAQEQIGDQLGGDGFDYAYSLQTWHVDGWADGAETAKQIITEEIFHMVTQSGYSVAHPAELGMDDFVSSIACREMAAASCVHWMHPENSCPTPGTHSQPPLVGTCAEANCDCTEWYHQVVLILAGQDPGWIAVGDQQQADADGYMIPHDRDALLATLSDDFKDMVANPALHQLQTSIPYAYDPPSGQTPDLGQFLPAPLAFLPPLARSPCSACCWSTPVTSGSARRVRRKPVYSSHTTSFRCPPSFHSDSLPPPLPPSPRSLPRSRPYARPACPPSPPLVGAPGRRDDPRKAGASCRPRVKPAASAGLSGRGQGGRSHTGRGAGEDDAGPRNPPPPPRPGTVSHDGKCVASYTGCIDACSVERSPQGVHPVHRPTPAPACPRRPPHLRAPCTAVVQTHLPAPPPRARLQNPQFAWTCEKHEC